MASRPKRSVYPIPPPLLTTSYPDGGSSTKDTERAEVVRRMEVFVLYLLHHMTAVSDVKSCASNESGDSRMQPAECGPSDTAVLPPLDSATDSVPPNLLLLPSLSDFSQKRKLRNELVVLSHIYSNLVNDASDGAGVAITSTQRDVYYHVCRLIPSQETVNAAIKTIHSTFLNCSRRQMGVVASSRGAVGGSIVFSSSSSAQSHQGVGDYSIPTFDEELTVSPPVPNDGSTSDTGDYYLEHDNTNGKSEVRRPCAFTLLPDTRCILIVEKHAVYHQLVYQQQQHHQCGNDRDAGREASFLYNFPCVVLTSCGYPNASAKQLLRNIHASAPDLPIYALADYNSDGLNIIMQYTFDSRDPLAVPTTTTTNGGTRVDSGLPVRWLGVRSCQLQLQASDRRGGGASPIPTNLPHKDFAPRDVSLLRNMITRLRERLAATASDASAHDRVERWIAEAEVMQSLKVKVEIECLYSRSEWMATYNSGSSHNKSDSIGSWVVQRILRNDYI